MAQFAGKIMEVTTPSPAKAAVSTTFELEHLHKEVAEFKSMLQALHLLNDLVLGDLPVHIGNRKSSAGTITSTVIVHRNANPHARSRETPRPLTEGNRHSWPLTHLPILHYRHNFQLLFSH